MSIRSRLFHRQHYFRKNRSIKLAIFNAFSLIEVLVAITIFAVGILGLAQLFLQTQRINQNNYFYSVAGCQLNGLVERLRANQTSQARQLELIRWDNENQQVLPAANGSYSCNLNVCNVELHWRYQGTEYQLRWQDLHV